MPATITESTASRERSSGDSASVTLKYTVRGTADDNEALGLVESTAPAYYAGLQRRTCRIEPVEISEGQSDLCIWEGTASYSPPRIVVFETGDNSFSFDTGGGSQHVTQSLATVSRTAAAGTAPDFKGAVGVTSDGVAGVDITVPVYNFAETHYIPTALISQSYKANLYSLTGRVNNAAFRYFAAGEVLFLGASGSQRGSDDWEITFRFAASPNRTNIAVGDITVPAKKGWEYLWVLYADEEDATAKRIVKRPVAAYVEQVYQYGDFSGLGIGS